MGRFQRNKLVIEQYEAKFTDELAQGIDPLLERGVPGVATYIEGIGWSLKPPG